MLFKIQENTIFTAKFSQEQIHRFETCFDVEKCLNYLKSDGKIAVATPRSFAKTLQMKENIFCFDSTQNIHNFLVVFMIRSNFTMRQPVNEMLKRIITSGLIKKWEKVLRFRKKVTNNISKQSSMVFSEVHSMNFTDMCSVFVFFMFFITISISVACLERIIHFKANSPTCKHFWKVLDEIVCGQRYYFLLERSDHDNVIIPFTK